MHSAHELLTRWPAFDVAAKRAHLQSALAHAVGDFASLDAAGRRALYAHLPSPDAALLRQLAEALLSHS